jgi:Cu/Ag efflux protein CusF
VFSALVVALLAMASGCNKAAEIKEYQLRGEIVELDATAKIVTIKHEDIEGWMDAMTMKFPVKDDKEFALLETGARITATVYVQDIDYWIGNVKVAP